MRELDYFVISSHWSLVDWRAINFPAFHYLHGAQQVPVPEKALGRTERPKLGDGVQPAGPEMETLKGAMSGALTASQRTLQTVTAACESRV